MTISKEKYEKAYHAAIVAEGFLNSAKLIDTVVRDGFERMWIYIYPHTVNAAASCELSLKALLTLQDEEYPDKHTLVGLYERIAERTKKEISERYRQEKCSMSLGKCLQTYNNSIVEWRYPFDDKYRGKTLKAAWKELIVLDTILCDVVEKQIQASPFYEEENIKQEEQIHAD